MSLSENKLSLEDQILAFLKKQGNGAKERALYIAKHLGFQKASDINSVLYGLEKKGLLWVTTGSPPLWSLEPVKITTAPPDANTTPETSDLQFKIAKELTLQGDYGLTTQELAGRLGQPRKVVSRQLYAMMNQLKLEKTNCQKWKLTDKRTRDKNEKVERTHSGNSAEFCWSDGLVKGDSRFLKDYDQIEALGEGGFGIVLKARKKLENKFYAVKIVRGFSETREVEALANLHHPNIVRFHTSWTEPYCQKKEARKGTPASPEMDDRKQQPSVPARQATSGGKRDLPSKDEAFSTGQSCTGSSKDEDEEEEEESSGWSDADISSKGATESLFIQTELCNGGTLRTWIQKRNYGEARSKHEAMEIFQQIVLGVEFIHTNGHMHRDLKPENILFGDDGKVKIGDFGLATTLNIDGEDIERTVGTGTLSYMSPEQETKMHYEEKVDIFSLGLILFELLWKMNTVMEKEKTWTLLRARVFPPEFKEQFQFEHQVIDIMLSVEPDRRPDASTVVKILLVLLGDESPEIFDRKTV